MFPIIVAFIYILPYGRQGEILDYCPPFLLPTNLINTQDKNVYWFMIRILDPNTVML